MLRRTFLKTLGAAIGAFTVQGRLRASEAKQASQYMQKFKETSLRPMKGVSLTGSYFPSGIYICTGMPISGDNL
jgi:secreted PhoX family phosphatase